MTPLSELQFTTIRTFNLLMQNGIVSVGELAKLSEQELMGIRGLSFATIADIEQALNRWYRA